MAAVKRKKEWVLHGYWRKWRIRDEFRKKMNRKNEILSFGYNPTFIWQICDALCRRYPLARQISFSDTIIWRQIFVVELAFTI